MRRKTRTNYNLKIMNYSKVEGEERFRDAIWKEQTHYFSRSRILYDLVCLNFPFFIFIFHQR
jgi:hypothetical protein